MASAFDRTIPVLFSTSSLACEARQNTVSYAAVPPDAVMSTNHFDVAVLDKVSLG